VLHDYALYKSTFTLLTGRTQDYRLDSELLIPWQCLFLVHSLNLVGVKYVECCVQVVLFFKFVRKLYTFFCIDTSLGDSYRFRWPELQNSNCRTQDVCLTPDGRLMRMHLRLCVKAMRTFSLHSILWRAMSISQKTQCHGLKHRVSSRISGEV